jgi:transcriptional regulator of met regulon
VTLVLGLVEVVQLVLLDVLDVLVLEETAEQVACLELKTNDEIVIDIFGGLGSML